MSADDELEMMLDPPRTNTNGRIGRDLAAPDKGAPVMINKWVFYVLGIGGILWNAGVVATSGSSLEVQVGSIGALMCLGIGAILDKLDQL